MYIYPLKNEPTSDFVEGEEHNPVEEYVLLLSSFLITAFPPYLDSNNQWEVHILINIIINYRL